MQTLPEFLRKALANERLDALVERVDGAWTKTSSGELRQRVENVALALRDAGLYRGERVAVFAENSVDWLVADFGTLFAACVVVPIFATQSAEHVRFILENSEAKFIFVDTPDRAELLRSLGMSLPPLVVFKGQGDASLAAFEARGAALRAQHPERAGSYEAEIEPKDLAVLIYTSGSTGHPKGVMLTHDNVASNATDSFGYGFTEITPQECALSVLPFAHIYEHMIVHGYLASGVAIYLCEDPHHLLDDLRDARPAVMSAVPRLFERVLTGILTKARHDGGVRAKLVPWALDVGRDYMRATLLGNGAPLTLRTQFAIAHALVLKKLRPILGLDRLRFFMSGSAPLHVDLALKFAGADITILQGYGATECAPVITCNILATNRVGSVGRPIPNVEVSIAGDGEVLVRGPNVMIGYYKDPGSTASAFEDGWYRTGDVGSIDADGYLYITDRKREVFKSSGGKFIAPGRVESAIARSLFVTQVMVVGGGRPHPVALVVPNYAVVRHELGISGGSDAELVQRPDVVGFIRKEVLEHTRDLSPWEQVRSVIVLPRELSIEDGELSPTMKIKRRVIEERYRTAIDDLYKALEPALPT